MKDCWFIPFHETQMAFLENLWKAAENKNLSLLLSFHFAFLSVVSKVYSFYSFLSRLRLTMLNNHVMYINENKVGSENNGSLFKDGLNFCDILPKN